MWFSEEQNTTVQYTTVQYSTVQYSTALYCTVLHCAQFITLIPFKILVVNSSLLEISAVVMIND